MEIDANQHQNVSYILAGEHHILQIIKPILLIDANQHQNVSYILAREHHVL